MDQTKRHWSRRPCAGFLRVRPKCRLTVASGNVAPHVVSFDIAMMYFVTDVQGLSRISRKMLGNAAHALGGMMTGNTPQAENKPVVGLTMFGVTTDGVNHIEKALKEECDPLVFHATGAGGQSMEQLVDSDMIEALIDLTRTEIADMMVGGVWIYVDVLCDRCGFCFLGGLSINPTHRSISATIT